VEATRIADFTAWPLHDNNDRIDFGNSDVEVSTTHFKGIHEHTDVMIDDVLTEWEIMKFNLMESKLKQANTNMNHILLVTFRFLFIY